nr:MAG TPA: hypothetical protein [Caudoviricetes sp.]
MEELFGRGVFMKLNITKGTIIELVLGIGGALLTTLAGAVSNKKIDQLIDEKVAKALTEKNDN